MAKEKLKQLAVELFKIDAIKFGEYKTKVGLMTPVYCDLRVIISYPKLLENLSSIIVEELEKLEKNVICGVPYTALPIATIVSTKSNIPMVMRRKEAKDYGTKKLIEGVFRDGDRCVIVEDVVTSGSSILETVKDLKGAGLTCTDAIVLLNREQGGDQHLLHNGIKMHALLSLSELMDYLKEANCITAETEQKVLDYLKNTQIDFMNVSKSPSRLTSSYEKRANFASNPVAKRLFNIITEKRTNLCIAADLTDATDILNLAEQVGPHICLFKTHIDIVEDFHPNFIKNLKSIAESHNFILFEDRKFADIGKTVELQYTQGIYKISSWAELVTAHSLTGKGVLDALKQSGGSNKGVFLLAETSAANNLIDSKYTNATVKLAEEYEDLVVGLVCQSRSFPEKLGMLQLTPGVQLGSSSDSLSQQYNSPEHVVLELGADIAVVGRGITKAKDPRQTAQEYKDLLWAAYEKRTTQ